MPRSPLGAEGPHVGDTGKGAPTVASQKQGLQDASLTAILWPQDAAANSNLCLIDLQVSMLRLLLLQLIWLGGYSDQGCTLSCKQQ